MKLFLLISIIFFPLCVSAESNSFNAPQKLCSTLSSIGLDAKSWQESNSFPGEYSCITSYVTIGSAGNNGLENNIAYYVDGTTAASVDTVKLVVNINNRDEEVVAKSRLKMAIEELFKTVDYPIPAGLMKAISANKNYKKKVSFGEVTYEVVKNKIDILKLTITNQDKIAAANKAILVSVQPFKNCKKVISKIVGYPVSKLEGDGSPVKEAGYDSFLVSGKNKDVFFCEVYAGNKYKIKAALKGNFPFEYIGEGSF